MPSCPKPFPFSFLKTCAFRPLSFLFPSYTAKKPAFPSLFLLIRLLRSTILLCMFHQNLLFLLLILITFSIQLFKKELFLLYFPSFYYSTIYKRKINSRYARTHGLGTRRPKQNRICRNTVCYGFHLFVHRRSRRPYCIADSNSYLEKTTLYRSPGSSVPHSLITLPSCCPTFGLMCRIQTYCNLVKNGWT